MAPAVEVRSRNRWTTGEVPELGFGERKMASCQQSRKSVWGRGRSKGKGFRRGSELGVFEDRSLASLELCGGGREQVERSAGPPWRRAWT